ncbi:hypothetical protein [Haloferax sp. YSSS75]|uniref:hypothetical protein n=1 Tax=Haloferax sp. YSSS75 TaxID=3388564 RepID=UPI00398CFBCE
MTDETTDHDVNDDTRSETLSAESERDDSDAPDGGPERQGDVTDTADERGDQMPLSDLADRVAERRVRPSSDTEDGEELFEEMQVAELDSEAVWTALIEDDANVDEEVGVGADAEPVEVTDSFSDYVVPKAEFCQRCDHFGDPPTLSCTHEGTTIVEVVDGEHFRVRNCPMVEED